MQEIGNCSTAFQYVQSMEIDQFNRMWIIDVGRINIFTTPINTCPPKLVIIDLNTDRIIRTHVFPANVVSYTENFLNDIVVGCKTQTDCWAYISDPGSVQIVMYSYEQDKSWNTAGMGITGLGVDDNATEIEIIGKSYEFVTAVDGIALSPLDSNFERLYYCPLSSYSLNYIKTSELQKAAVTGTGRVLPRVAVWLGTKASQTDGMTIDASGHIFYGRLNQNAVVYFDTTKYLNGGSLNKTAEITLAENVEDIQWADTFAFDNNGFLYYTPNRLQLFINDTYDFDQVNFRVVRSYIGKKSYMFSEEGGGHSGCSRVNFTLWFIAFFVGYLIL
jgi:sugar lactone lactonase YvrE